MYSICRVSMAINQAFRFHPMYPLSHPKWACIYRDTTSRPPNGCQKHPADSLVPYLGIELYWFPSGRSRPRATRPPITLLSLSLRFRYSTGKGDLFLDLLPQSSPHKMSDRIRIAPYASSVGGCKLLLDQSRCSQFRLTPRKDGRLHPRRALQGVLITTRGKCPDQSLRPFFRLRPPGGTCCADRVPAVRH
ncbi:uncharacterized protein LY79DRAFT_22821 [Colletotrichum navitas]|uniref:Uncharacterized protein n=1 Tax=Colletotrichum navitas TaxID=681940 RepID=A0AAD8QFK2_9PEZI|nr:uncharacterized protein LY79DRAFT_22821 [Colletotrichum navitas]KAK1600522.1 hypothetical protein LY79DRAFT_22821 [Colletotrichum navitas]